MIEVRSPKSSKEWEFYYELRYEELRKPWKQPRGSEKADDEDSAFHFAAFEGEQLLGVCRLQENDRDTCQARFMAVAKEAQGKGVGKKIMAEAERFAKEQGWKEIILQARDNAVPFYQSMNYKIKEKTTSFLMKFNII